MLLTRMREGYISAAASYFKEWVFPGSIGVLISLLADELGEVDAPRLRLVFDARDEEEEEVLVLVVAVVIGRLAAEMYDSGATRLSKFMAAAVREFSNDRHGEYRMYCDSNTWLLNPCDSKRFRPNAVLLNFSISTVQYPPFPLPRGVSLEVRGTFTKHGFSDKLCRMVFYSVR